VIRVLHVIFAEYPITRGLRIARKLQVPLIDVSRGAAEFYIRPVRLKRSVGGIMMAAAATSTTAAATMIMVTAAAGLATTAALTLHGMSAVHV
jgi:hypothetical protein